MAVNPATITAWSILARLIGSFHRGHNPMRGQHFNEGEGGCSEQATCLISVKKYVNVKSEL